MMSPTSRKLLLVATLVIFANLYSCSQLARAEQPDRAVVLSDPDVHPPVFVVTMCAEHIDPKDDIDAGRQQYDLTPDAGPWVIAVPRHCWSA